MWKSSIDSVHIATVSEGGSLKVEMRLKRGRGYVSADRNFDEDLSLGYIPIDSVHTPVKKVNYTVEAARLGQNTEFDKLTIEVWTDGSVKPEDSIGLAAKLIKDHMSIFINFEEDTDDFAYSKISGHVAAFSESDDDGDTAHLFRVLEFQLFHDIQNRFQSRLRRICRHEWIQNWPDTREHCGTRRLQRRCQ